MSRSWISDTDQRWVMRCDVKGCPATSEAFPAQPDLGLFRSRSWFVADKTGDMCPGCLATMGLAALIGGKGGS